MQKLMVMKTDTEIVRKVVIFTVNVRYCSCNQ